jgi:hypothetical protein
VAQQIGEDLNTSSDRCGHPSEFGNGTNETKANLPNGASKQVWSIFDWLVNKSKRVGAGAGRAFLVDHGAAPTPTATPTPKALAFSMGP